jgi:N-formylglutamate deformylase
MIDTSNYAPGTSFVVVEPRATETPVIVEIPHASVRLDSQSMAYCSAPARSIGQDADLFVDELFVDAPDHGAHLIYSALSRYVCDLNRAEDDLDEMTSPVGTKTSSPHGVVWRKTTENRPAIVAPLPSSEIERRLELIYRPYHRALDQLVQRKLERFGVAVLICGHSMPSFGRLGERRADVVPGSQGRTTAGHAILTACDTAAQAAGYDVAHDNPYRGGFSTVHYGHPSRRVHALQVELARRLYMDERSLICDPRRFQTCRNFCSDLIRQVKTIASE